MEKEKIAIYERIANEIPSVTLNKSTFFLVFVVPLLATGMILLYGFFANWQIDTPISPFRWLALSLLVGSATVGLVIISSAFLSLIFGKLRLEMTTKPIDETDY